MEPEFAKIKAVDFLQGMLVLVALREVISDVVQSELPALQAQALGLGKELVAESKSLYEEISSKVDELERIVELSKYSGDDGSEDRLVRHFVNEGRAHPMLAVAQAMQSVSRGKTFQVTLESLWAAVKDNLPRAPRSSPESYFVHIANLGKAQTFMTMLNADSGATGASQKQGREYTREEDKAHIKRQSEIIRGLRAQVKANRGEENPSTSGEGV